MATTTKKEDSINPIGCMRASPFLGRQSHSTNRRQCLDWPKSDLCFWSTQPAEMPMTEFAIHLLQLAYLMLPAYAANMAPPFVRFWKGWNRPIHAPTLGDHKTVIGFAVGVFVGVVVTGLQKAIDAPFALVDYAYWPWLGLGFGAGAMTGDCIKSYFKRRRGVAPGRPWIPFDQLDFVVGSLLVVGPFVEISVGDIAFILAMSLLADMLVNRVAYRLGIKTSPW